MILFFISCEEELDRLISGKEQLMNAKYIIILPENGDDMAGKALTLRPRYIGYFREDFTDISTVLDRMKKKYG